MLKVISYRDISRNADLFFSQFQLRHREFVERQQYGVVDRLFDVAELRLGTKRQSVVRLTRTEPKTTAKALAMGGGHD